MTRSGARGLLALGPEALSDPSRGGFPRAPLGELSTQPVDVRDHLRTVQLIRAGGAPPWDGSRLQGPDGTPASSLERRAMTDSLTGAGTRDVLLHRVRHALSRLERQPLHLGMLLIDVDHFKRINDHHGHRAGDQALVAVAERLTAALRPSDTLVRLGGDEFAVLAEDLSCPDEALALADRLVAACHPRLTTDFAEVTCTVSIGVTTTHEARTHIDTLLDQADVALYEAKAHGGNRVASFDDRLRRTALRRTTLEKILRAAFVKDQFVVDYLPVVDLLDGSLVAAEALVRVATVGRRSLPARSFLDVAERSNLLHEIDLWVCQQAVSQARQWSIEASLAIPVAINVCARSLADADFTNRLTVMLSESGLPVGGVRIEMTESTLAGASEDCLLRLNGLRQAGVLIGLDDFGRGHSSMSTFRRCPLDYVKIDSSLIAALNTDPHVLPLVKAIITLARGHGSLVIAEGVQTRLQANDLLGLGCQQAQGHLWARSGAADAVLAFGRSRGMSGSP